MKKTVLALVALLGLSFAAPVAARADAYYVAVATWTAGGNGTKSVAFQNISAQDVEVLRIEVSNAQDGGAITGGLQAYWVYASTAMTHGGTSQTLGHSLRAANTALPSSIVSFSTGPTLVAYENNSAAKAAMPLIRPLFVNNDETATAQLSDAWSSDLEPQPLGSAKLGILLPASSNRGIILEQRNMANTSVTAGVVQARIVYRVK